jgi:hypothetical protein
MPQIVQIFQTCYIANVLVLRCVKDESYFSNLKILKSSICKKLSPSSHAYEHVLTITLDINSISSQGGNYF